jgi:methionyl-tRNA formyltransferase
MNVAFLSGVEFGHDLLEHILNSDFNISIVFSYDDNKKNFFSDYASFDKITKKFNIPHKKVFNINDEENITLLKKIQPDILLVMGWSQLLKQRIIEIPKIGVIGSHPTELPKYRGRAPIPWTILKELKKSALTFFWIDSGTDSGDILDQQFFNVFDDDDAFSLYKKITKLGKQMLEDNLKKFNNNIFSRFSQDKTQFIENWGKRTPEDGIIDWSKPAHEILKLIRATTYPYPGAFTFFDGSKLKIWNAEKSDENNFSPGQIIKITDKGVKIGTGNGTLVLKIVSLNDDDVSAIQLFSNDDVGKFLK